MRMDGAIKSCRFYLVAQKKRGAHKRPPSLETFLINETLQAYPLG
jgi:hypothetical protein